MIGGTCTALENGMKGRKGRKGARGLEAGRARAGRGVGAEGAGYLGCGNHLAAYRCTITYLRRDDIQAPTSAPYGPGADLPITAFVRIQASLSTGDTILVRVRRSQLAAVPTHRIASP